MAKPNRRSKPKPKPRRNAAHNGSGPQPFAVTHHDIRLVDLGDLTPAPYNPRVMSADTMAGLTESLRRFGLVEPIIWNKRTGYVVGGHQRLSVLQNAGVKQAQVVVIDLSPTEEKALNVALNNLNGEWNFALLKDLLTELHPNAEDRILLGFPQQELDALLKWGEQMSAAPDGGIGRNPDEALEIYNNNAIKQFVFYFSSVEYIQVLERMKVIAERQNPPLETNSAVFLYLLDFYEKTAR